MTAARPWVLVLGTADWDQAIATNQHYVVREMAREYDVVFVESQGLRRPELRWRDISRILARVRRMAASAIGRAPQAGGFRRPVPAGVTVITPKVAPIHTGVVARINEQVLRRQLRGVGSGGRPVTLWAYTPVTYGFERQAGGLVYHCVDLLGAVPGISNELIVSAEKTLARIPGVEAIGTSPVVAEHLSDEIGFPSVHLWPNVADFDAILAGRPATLARKPRSLVFAGNLSATKVDFDALGAALADGWDVHLAGPISEGGGDATERVDALVAAGATYHGSLDMERLAELYWSVEVGLIPYQLNEYTRGVNPLKTYEYLAAGLGVVSTPVPAVIARESDVAVVPASEIVAALATIDRSPEGEDERLERRQAIARENSWAVRGEKIRELLGAIRDKR